MPRYAFRAVDRGGTSRSGDLEAASAGDVLAELERRGWIALRIEPPSFFDLASLRRPFGRAGLKFQELVDLTLELAALLRAGLTIDRALAITVSLTERPVVKGFLGRLLDQIREGRSFADALSTEKGLPEYYPSMIRAGEIGGALPIVMARTGAFMAKAQELKNRVLSALIYPMILLGMIGVTLILVMFVVLPRFERLFAEAGARLPLPTRIVIGVGHFVTGYGIWLALVLAGCVLFAGLEWRKLSVRRRVHGWILEVRAIGPIIRKIDTARFLRTLATLLSNGATLPASIRIARGALTNLALAEATDTVLKRLREGASLADRLAHAKVFPRIAVQLVRVGEESGRLEEMLAETADILDREAQQSIERGLALFVPAVTITMGLLVAALIASVLVGILSLNDLAY